MSDKSKKDRDAKANITGRLPVSRRALLFGTGAAASLAALNGIGIMPAHAAAAGVASGPSHNDLMERLRRRHPPSVADLGDLGELPENERPAPRNATPAPDDPSD